MNGSVGSCEPATGYAVGEVVERRRRSLSSFVCCSPGANCLVAPRVKFLLWQPSQDMNQGSWVV